MGSRPEDRYYSNSLQLLTVESVSYPLIYFSIAWGLALLGHSFYINGWSRTRSIRFTSELCSLCCVFQGSLLLQCADQQCTLASKVIIYDLLAVALLSTTIQLCDNYITFERYQTICGRATRTHKIMLGIYVFIFLYLSWTPFHTVLPLAMNIREGRGKSAYDALQDLHFAAYIVFNITYTVPVVRQVVLQQRIDTVDIASWYLLVGMAVRTCLHTLFSIVGIVLVTFVAPNGRIGQTVCVTAGIHFFINAGRHKDYLLFSRLCGYPLHAPVDSAVLHGLANQTGPALVIANDETPSMALARVIRVVEA